MRVPIIGVTGPIASGKSTVAKVIARRGGVVLDCDELAHRALDDPKVKERLVEAFGSNILLRSGKISRTRLRSVVFASRRSLEILNGIVRPCVRSIITEAVRGVRNSRKARYIVLDAVLLFQYRFSFRVDMSIAVLASEEARTRRLMRRDEVKKTEAKSIVELQRCLERDWIKADVVIDGELPIEEMKREAQRIRDEFVAKLP